jgi:hypothetical protein
VIDKEKLGKATPLEKYLSNVDFSPRQIPN